MENDKSKEIRKKILDLVRIYSDYNFLNKNFIEGETEIPVSGKVIGTLELQNMTNPIH